MIQYRRLLVSLSCVPVVLLPGLVQAASPQPRVFEPRVERHQGPPLWIAAQAVADSQKTIDLDVVDSPALRMNVDSQRRALAAAKAAEAPTGEGPTIAAISPRECRRTLLSTGHRGGSAGSETPKDLAGHSRSILRGTVRALEPGFSFGEPSTLLEIELSGSLKGAPVPVSAVVYVDYPIARFRIGSLHFCNGNQGYEPRAGDEVLLFDFTGPVDRDGLLYAPRFDQLFFQSQGGTLILPQRLKDVPELRGAKTLNDVVQVLAERKLLEPEMAMTMASLCCS